MAVIPVDVAGRPYEVRIGTGLLANLVAECSGRLRKRRVPVVTDANVHARWGAVVDHALHDGGHDAVWRILPPGIFFAYSIVMYCRNFLGLTPAHSVNILWK